jgi:hypothetical protein
MTPICADVQSPNGTINFDVQSDGQTEMNLNTTGLGIGATPAANLHVGGNAIVSQQLFVGGSSGSSNLNITGTLGYSVQTVSSNTTLAEYSIVLVDTSSSNITLTLPSASSTTGRTYKIKRITNDDHGLKVTSSDNIDGLSDYYDLSQLSAVKFISDGRPMKKVTMLLYSKNSTYFLA